MSAGKIDCLNCGKGHAEIKIDSDSEIANAPLPYVCPDCCAGLIRSGFAHAGILCAGCEFTKQERGYGTGPKQ